MSYQKALEVLGVSEAVVEEERARRLGELGLGLSQGSIIHEGEDICGGFFIKRRRSASQDGVSLGTTLSGEVAFGPTHVSLFCMSIDTQYFQYGSLLYCIVVAYFFVAESVAL